MLPSTFQKRLDKDLVSWYNTRKKSVKKRYDLKKITEEFVLSTDKRVSKVSNEDIFSISKALKIVAEEFNIRCPIIAGGAIRDTVYGLTPKDIDVFFDTSSVPEDDREDFTLMVGLRTLEELSKIPKYEAFLLPLMREHSKSINSFDSTYVTKTKTNQKEWKTFFVYDGLFNTGLLDALWNDLPEEVDDYVGEELIRSPSIQFIGRPEEFLSKDDPSGLLDTFDWSLTKGLFDPTTMKYHLSEEFLNQTTQATIEVSNNHEFERAYFWTLRMAEDTRPFKKVINLGRNESEPGHNLNLSGLAIQLKKEIIDIF